MTGGGVPPAGGVVGVISPWLGAQLLNHALGVQPMTPPTQVYVGLFLDTSGTGSEISAPDYTRLPASFAQASGNPAISVTAADIEWAPAQQDWGTCVAGGLFDAATGGNFYGWGNLVAADGVTEIVAAILRGEVFRIPAGQLLVGIG